MSSAYRIWVIAIILSFSTRLPALAQEGDVPAIIRDWLERRKIAESVAYEVVTEQTVAKGSLFKDSEGNWPKEDFTSQKKVAWLMHFGNNWLRKETFSFRFYLNIHEFKPCYELQVFDGIEGVTFQPREKNISSSYTPSEFQPDLEIVDGAGSDDFIDPFFDLPLFLGHGLVPTLNDRPFPSRLIPPMTSKDYVLYGKGKVEGVTCDVIRTLMAPSGRLHEFWVDRSKGSAILRYQRYANGKIINQTNVTYRRAEGAWLPQMWTSTNFEPEGTTMSVEVSKVAKSVLNAPVNKQHFQVKSEPGRIVEKVSSGKRYRVLADGSLEDLIIGKQQTSGISIWVWTCIIGVGLGGATIFVFKRRTHKSVIKP